MGKRKTEEEVKNEIVALMEIAKLLPGSRSKINAQIEVLDKRLSNDDVYDQFEVNRLWGNIKNQLFFP